MKRWLFLAFALIAFPACGEPATARYAAAQLGVAQVELKLAREARARGDALLAERLAVQAALDARLAWTMSDSPALRNDAADLHRRAALLRRSMNAVGVAASSAAVPRGR